jgi:acyl-CoA thioester hydrolase
MTESGGEQPAIAGRIVDGRHVLPIRVYYEDTDFSGIVYHANYLKFCERGRSDLLRLLGIAHRELGRSGLAFAVRRMTCDFLKPARIDDLLEVVTRGIELGGARLELAQSVQRGDAMLFTAEITLALIDASGRPRRLPEALAVSLGGLMR